MGYWKYIGETPTNAQHSFSYTEHILDTTTKSLLTSASFTMMNNAAADIQNILPIENSGYEVENSVLSPRYNVSHSWWSGNHGHGSPANHGVGRWTGRRILSCSLEVGDFEYPSGIPCMAILSMNSDSVSTGVIMSYTGGIAWGSSDSFTVKEIYSSYYLVTRWIGVSYSSPIIQFICPINTWNGVDGSTPAPTRLNAWALPTSTKVDSWRKYYSTMTWDDGETLWTGSYIPTTDRYFFDVPAGMVSQKTSLGAKTTFAYTEGTFSHNTFSEVSDGSGDSYTETGIINEVGPYVPPV